MAKTKWRYCVEVFTKPGPWGGSVYVGTYEGNGPEVREYKAAAAEFSGPVKTKTLWKIPATGAGTIFD